MMKKEAKSIDLSAAVKMVAVCRPTFVSYHSQFDELSSIRSKFNTNHQRTTRIEFESNPMNSKRTTIQTAASIVRDSALKVAGTMGAQQAQRLIPPKNRNPITASFDERKPPFILPSRWYYEDDDDNINRGGIYIYTYVPIYVCIYILGCTI